jgi:cell fate regulator YaaT (PSP1 superfamily)
MWTEQLCPLQSVRKPPMVAPQYIVRHGTIRFLGEYQAGGEDRYRRGDRVIVRSDRGVELGEVLCEASPQAIECLTEPTRGQILRTITPEDDARIDQLHEQEQKEIDLCCRLVSQRQLQMEMVDVEHLFGGERVVFYFLAEKRVDFRDLVKDLARELKTRIELRQIGVRDEAKLLADYGDCGKPVCCNTHLSVMPPVSMRMAKLQKSTLDPTKISGRCGRLKCCLRYEMNVYEEFQSTLPPVGSRILTRKGQGRVLAHEILARKVLAEFEDGRRVIVAADEILTGLGS